MLCEQILGNIGTLHPDGLDTVDFAWNELARRAFRKRSAGGIEIKILLPLGVSVRDGDVLAERDGKPAIVARVLPCEVIVVKPPTPTALAELALEVGNLHAPAEVTPDGQLLILPDGPVEAVLKRMGIAYSLETRLFSPLRCGPFVTSRL